MNRVWTFATVAFVGACRAGSPVGATGTADLGASGGGGARESATGGSGLSSFGGGGSSAGGPVGSGGATPDSVGLPFLLGADVTITLEDEYWGASYSDGGVKKPLEEILVEHGFNAIRIGTFVSPGVPGGYSSGQPENFRDLAHTITLAQRAKAKGMVFLLDLLLSDTWADPAHQAMPSLFVGLSGEALRAALHDYVRDTVQALVDAGVRPDLVQLGNEITNGFLWDEGRIIGSDFSKFAALLKSGIGAVREIDPDITVMLHIERCHDLEASRWWLDGVLGEGVVFDALGQSCYADAYLEGVLHKAGYQGTPAEWKTTLEALASEYPGLRFAIAEHSAEPRAAGDVMRGLSNGRGIGTFNWDPTRHYETHPNVPLFSTDGAWNKYVAVPERIGVYDKMASEYGLR